MQDKSQNEVRLQLHALAYNLGMFLQAAELPDEVASWLLTSLQTWLIKIGARVGRRARKITFQLVEVVITRVLFHRILAAIHRLRTLAGALTTNDLDRLARNRSHRHELHGALSHCARNDGRSASASRCRAKVRTGSTRNSVRAGVQRYDVGCPRPADGVASGRPKATWGISVDLRALALVCWKLSASKRDGAAT